MLYGDLEISVSTNFLTSCTRSTVTDYLVRKIEITNQKTGGVAVKKDKVLWRTTSQGLTGADLDTDIEKVQVKDGLIIISFSDGEKVEIPEAELNKPKIEPEPDVVTAIDLQIRKELDLLRKARENLQIPVKTFLGEQKYRPADVGRFGEVEFTSNNTARVILWEEIDYRAVGGDAMYATQKRLLTYEVTPKSIKEVHRETLGYE